LTIAYIGIGSNLDRPRERVHAACEALARISHTRLAKRSSLYRSAPQGHREQPDFVNAVAALDTVLSARRLFGELQRIELEAGRERSFRNAPRTLDLDLLLFGDERIQDADLLVPHPRMHERAFVLVPLLEIAPDAVIPGVGRAREHLAANANQRVERLG
jgi:2-amino-4-hydroxy-6-hydroxymethyldihydropteridine diphosphokinase